MEILELTKDNANQYGYGCMMKGNLFLRKPQPYRESLLPELTGHLDKGLRYFFAVDQDKPVAHLMVAPLPLLGVPIIARPDVPAIFCTYVTKGYAKKGLGRSLVEKAKQSFPESPGLLILTTKTRMYMPFQSFQRLGFKSLSSHDLWNIGYLPVKQDSIQIDFFDPELEWDYVKPFTLIRGGVCPFLLHVWDVQKKAAESFKEYAPVVEVSLQEARVKDPGAVPGFYVFGKMAPAKPMFGWQFKLYIQKAIRKEEKKTFGAATPSGYKKRKT